MKTTTITTKRLNVCTCGFNALKDEITETNRPYVVLADEDGNPTVSDGFSWGCGGCGDEFEVEVVHAQDSFGDFRPLPIDLFIGERE